MENGTPPPETEDDDWQQDREVFGRQQVTGRDGNPVTEVYISPEVRLRWLASIEARTLPPKFTPDMAILLINAMRSGCQFDTAAHFAGISKRTYYDWMDRARERTDKWKGKSTEELRQWMRELEKVMAEVVMGALANIHRAARAGSWQASAWFLERRYPNDWRQKTSSTLENPDGSPASPPQLKVTLFESGDETTPIENPDNDPSKKNG